MPFKKGHPPYRSSMPGAYSVPTPRGADYEPIDAALVPTGIKWKPAPPYTGPHRAFVSMFGGAYRLVRELATGEVQYFKLKDVDPAPATPKEKIDAEPERKGQVRYRVGCRCWLIVESKWFLVEVVARTGENRATFGEPKRITVKSATGRDAEHNTEWPYEEELTFTANPRNMTRLRPLKDRSQ